MGTIRRKAIDSLITSIEDKAIGKNRFEPFADLEHSEQYEVMDILNMAFSNVFKTQIENREDVTLPTIAKIKIKKVNKIALEHKKQVAVDMNYIDFNNIPLDKLDEANSKVKELTINTLKSAKKVNREVKELTIIL